MYEVLFVDRGQPGSYLRHDLERQLRLEPSGAFDEVLDCLSLHKLHGVEVVPATFAKVENRGDVGMPDTGRDASFAHESQARRFVT